MNENLPVLVDGARSHDVLSADDVAALDLALNRLERASLAARLTNIVGRQIDHLGRHVPENLRNIATRAASEAMQIALKAALASLGRDARGSSRTTHKALAALSGAAGGAFGIASLPIELPVSTTLMLRAIADIARSEGEALDDPEAALACMQVFALGGRVDGENHVDGGYFAVRSLLAQSITEATRFVVERGVAEEGAPVLVRLVAMISARFGVVVTQKAVAQAVPVIGALSGAAINYAFMDHFQSLARGHFVVRRLERTYGADAVREAFEQLRLQKAGDAARPV